MNDLTNQSVFEGGYPEQAKIYLNETAKWAKFLAIVSFVMIGLMVIMGLFMGSIFSSLPMGNTPYSNLPSGFFIAYFLIIAAIMFFPAYYLYKFAVSTKKGIELNTEEEITLGLENLKSLFKFYGIFTIVILGFYALGIVFGILGSLLM